MKNLIISPAPHAHNNDTVQKTMLNVLIALVPAYLVSLYFFGLGALIVSLTAVISFVLFEYLIQRFLLKGKQPCRVSYMIYHTSPPHTTAQV